MGLEGMKHTVTQQGVRCAGMRSALSPAVSHSPVCLLAAHSWRPQFRVVTCKTVAVYGVLPTHLFAAPQVRMHFRPEFINRIDEFIIFQVRGRGSTWQ